MHKKITYLYSNYVNYGIYRVINIVFLKLISKPYYLMRDNRRGEGFDERYGVHTNKIINLNESDLDLDKRKDAQPYVPTEPCICLKAFQWAKITPSDYTFVDIGSGLGRILILASLFGFTKVIGVELSEQNTKLAEVNLKTYKNHTQRNLDYSLLNMSALDFTFPCTPLCVYLYKPFSDNIYVAFLKTIERLIQTTPSTPFVLISIYPYDLNLTKQHAPSLQIIKNIEVDDAYHCWQIFKNRNNKK